MNPRIYGAARVTEYSLGTRWAPMIQGFMWAGISALMPLLTQMEAKGDLERTRAVVLRAARISTAIAVPMCLVPCVLGDVFLDEYLSGDCSRLSPEAPVPVLKVEALKTRRVLGGAVLGRRALIHEPLTAFLRNAGPTLSPFNAWVVLKGLETLKLRMGAYCAGALELARWLEAHPRVQRVYYPGLPSHPQHALAARQQSAGGGIVSFVVTGGREAAWRVVDSTRMISITANLGDTKTTITHPASTTHGRLSPEARAAAGIEEGLLRVAVGLESVRDIQADLARGLG
jgi:hypothetical protein